MRVSIYGHSGSYNHGNEAVVRGLSNILKERVALYCTDPYIDRLFGLDDVVDLIPEGVECKSFMRRNMARLKAKMIRSDKPFLKDRYKNLTNNINGIYVFTAEDQYNESRRTVEWFEYQNRRLNLGGGITIAVGASIDPSLIGKTIKIQDLKRYHTIIARESITYNGLKKYGVSCELAPCPAFIMKPQKCDLPVFFSDNVVGVNFGPLAQGNEKYNEIYMRNCVNYIKWILKETDFNIALIPHMNWHYQYSDFEMHDKLYCRFKKSGRVYNVNEDNAPKMKYMISKCRFLITTRTHVAVAGYSSCVPTLVTGYKMKSTGIARDIFGCEEHYVMPIQSLGKDDDFIKAFQWIMDNEYEIKEYMKVRIPEYEKGAECIKHTISRVRIS